MENTRILFITYFYPPQKYPRSIQISHLVQSLSSSFSIKTITLKDQKNNDPSLLSFTPVENVIYLEKSKIGHFIEYSRGYKIKTAILPDLYYLEHFNLAKNALQTIHDFNPKIIVTFGQPMSTHIVGLKIKKKYPHIKWLAHFSDPWIDNIFNEYNRISKLTNSYYQNQVFKHADTLIFTSQETIDLVATNTQNKIQSKCLSIPHIFNKEILDSKHTHTKNQSDKKIVIRYLGNFYGDRHPKYLFEALKKIPKAQITDLKIELIGKSIADISQYIKHYNLEKIITHKESITYLDSLAAMQNSDLLLIIDAPMKLSPFLPSKLIDYIGANKPIFGITPPGTSQKLIEEMGYLVAHPNNPEEIAHKLKKMIQNIKTGKIKKIPDHIRNRFKSSTVAKQMSNLLNKICTV